MKRVIIEILQLQKERFVLPRYQRTIRVEPDLPKVQTISGPRRAGKSALLRLTIGQLLESGVPWERICYVSLEDERLRDPSFEPDMILQAFAELYPHNPLLNGVYFLFDEVQYLRQWEAFVNRVHEQVSRTVIITGSNSKLLHTEVAGVLRGRGLPTELLPLSFSEYLHWNNIEFRAVGSQKTKVLNAFSSYLKEGGYPETLNMEDFRQRALLQEYFNTVMYRDIIDQQHPANYGYLRYLFHRIADNTGKPTGLRKIYRELKSRGFAISQGTLYEMADWAEAVYLYKRISRFDASMIKRENADKKSYFIDNGMLRALSSSFSEDLGKLLENLVFWQLYRQYGSIYTTDIYYYKDASHECDFVLYKEGGKALPIQVCLDMKTEDTRQRELKGLLKACKATDSLKGIIITYDSEEAFEQQDIKIKVIPAWKWCGQEFDLFNV